jgi:transcription antitermination factor NusG
VPGKVIQTIKDTSDENNMIAIRSPKFKKGDRIFIREGPFKNFYGIFERELKGSERVMILFDAMCRRQELNSHHLAKA